MNMAKHRGVTLETTWKTKWAHPLQPGSYRNKHLFSNSDSREEQRRLTPFQGLAMKLGMMPCFIPTLLAMYLNRIALSAIFSAEVYANAVSRTPGPVSVSIASKFSFRKLGVRWMVYGGLQSLPRTRCFCWTNHGNTRYLIGFEEESIHALQVYRQICEHRKAESYRLPGVKGCRLVKFFSEAEWGVSSATGS